MPDEAKHLDRHLAVALGDEASATWRLANRTRPVIDTAIITPDVDAAAAAAIAGIGLAQLPNFVIADALSDGRLVRILPEDEPQTVRMKASYSVSHWTYSNGRR